MDPLTLITLISTGLGLVDQFWNLVIRARGQAPTPPSGKAEQVGTGLELRHHEMLLARVESRDLRMDQWDSVRYEALSKRTRTNWYIYNDLFTSEAGASAQEGARIRNDMRNTQESLCHDFKEMVGLYERVLGTSLPDHYQLYDICR